MIGPVELAEQLRLASSATDTLRAVLDLAAARAANKGDAPPEPVTVLADTTTSDALSDLFAVAYRRAVHGDRDALRSAVTRLLAFTDHRGIPTLDDGLLCDIGDVLDGSALPAVTVTNDRIDPDSLDALLRRGAANFVVNWLSNPRWVETTQSLWQASTRELDAIEAAGRHPLIPLAAAWLSDYVPPEPSDRQTAIHPSTMSAGLAISDRDHIRLAPILTPAIIDTPGVATLPGVTDDAAHKWLYAPRSGHGAPIYARLTLEYITGVPVAARRAGNAHTVTRTVGELAAMLLPDGRDAYRQRRRWRNGDIPRALAQLAGTHHRTTGTDGVDYLTWPIWLRAMPADPRAPGSALVVAVVSWPWSLDEGRGPQLHRTELARLGAVNAPAWRLWQRLAHDWHHTGYKFRPLKRRTVNLPRVTPYRIDHLVRYTLGALPTHGEHRRRTIRALMVLAARGDIVITATDNAKKAYGRGHIDVRKLPRRWLDARRGRGVRIWPPDGWLTPEWSPAAERPSDTSTQLPHALTA